MPCPSCGAAAPDSARFCPSCGQPLVTQPDERRVASVLFADLVGFTTYSEAADPEHVKNLVDTCFDRLAADITSFGGTVDKIVGDSIVALFGAPIAHEDDPERAVRAALAIQQTMRSYCAEHSVAIELRVGINTGEVLVGGLRAGDDYTAMGDVVNAASRLQELAPPGRILVGPATYAATHSVITYEPAGAVSLRGREQEIETWLAVSTVSRPGRHTVRGTVPFVGRELEVAILTNTIGVAEQRGRGSVVLLVGEAGVGKSRLVDEVVATTAATVLHGHCVPYGDTNPWSPIGDALLHLLDIEAQDCCSNVVNQRLAAMLDLDPGDDETLRIAAGLSWFIGLAEPTDVDPARARDEAIRSLQMLFESIARTSTLVLVLSDLHWADEAMFELLDTLMTRMSEYPFVVLVTARPELGDRWSPSLRLETNVLQLGPLDNAATATLAHSHLGDDAPRGIVDALVERSGGNPYFVEELVAIASETGDSSDASATQGAVIRSLPATLRGLVTARLDVLESEVRGVLADCAVIGSTGSIELVAALGAARAVDNVAASLRTLAERGLISRTTEEYRFRSELVREIAYGTLTKAARAERHVAIARWSEEQSPPSETEHLEHLAMHYGTAASLANELGGLEDLPADLTERAAAAHDAAATHAEHFESWPRAENHLDAAIALSGESDPHYFERLIRVLRARIQRYRLAEVEDDLAHAEELASVSEDPTHVVSALLLRGLFDQRRERHNEAVIAYDRAIELADDLGDRQSVADGLRGRGLALLFTGRLDDARSAFGDALEIFSAIGDRRGAAWALQNLAWIAFLSGNPTDADERLDAAVDTFTELRDWGGLDWALGLRAWVRFNQGRLPEAEKLALEIYGEGEESGDAWALGMMGVLLAQIALWTGRPAVALERCAAVREQFVELDDQYGTFPALIPIPRALACLGRFDEAADALDEVAAAGAAVGAGGHVVPSVLHISIAGHIGDPNWRESPAGTSDESPVVATNHELAVASALVRLQGGEVAEALEALATQYARAESDSAMASSGVALAIAQAAAGRADEAFALTSGLVELVDGSYLDRLQAWIGRAAAAAQLGDAELATNAATRAVELADETESPLDQAVTRLARAVVLETLDHTDAPSARADADARLDAVGTRAPGWERAIALAASGGRAG